MEVLDVLHMNGGIGDTSYSSNSLVQRKVISMTKPIIEEAIIDLYSTIFPKTKTLCIADLGCSSGPNTLFLVSELIDIINKFRLKSGHNQSLEFQIYLNDLPGNDFNTIFRSLPKFQENLKKQMGSGFGPCFFNGVPGSFYGRLFASRCLHFVHSSYSLHWLSQGSIEEGKVDSFNVPAYTPTPKEVELEVEKEGSFIIDRLKLSNVHWNASNEGLKDLSNEESCGYNVAKCMRAVLEPMLVSHFGESIMDELFMRYGKIIANSMLVEKTEYINITISMTKI